MVASRIEARAVFKVMAIVVIAIGVAVLLNHVVVEVKTTIRWVCAAIFLALALSPLVDLIGRARIRGHGLPRWLAILVAYVLFLVAFIFLVLERDPADRPRGRGARLAAADLRQGLRATGRTTTSSSASSTTSTTSPRCSRRRPAQIPAKLGDAAGAAKEITVGILNNVVEAVVVLTLTFFLLLDGGQQFRQADGAPARARARARPPGGRCGSPGSSAPTSRSTCCWRRSPASSPGSRWRCSGSSSRFRWRSWSRSSTSCR